MRRILPAVLLLSFHLAAACERQPSRRGPFRAVGPAATAAGREDGSIPELRAKRVPDGTIRVDGLLDEDAWRDAGTTSDLVGAGDGAPVPDSRVNGEAWIAWDRARLFVAVRIRDPDPAAPFGRDDEDPHVWERSSGVELMLQPGDPGDNREYYEVQVDTAGALWATSFDDYNSPITGDGRARRFGHQEWSPAIERAAVVDREAGHYAIEFSIPWSDLRSSRVAVPPRPGDVWRANVYSFRDGQRDALAWSPIRGEGNFHRASRFGRVVFEDEGAPAVTE